MCVVEDLIGKVIVEVSGLEEYSNEVHIRTTEEVYTFYHEQDCCEVVLLEDYEMDGDLNGATILSAEEVESGYEDACESGTWTFYKVETTKGGLWMRWLGESNGYYSEAVYIRKEVLSC